MAAAVTGKRKRDNGRVDRVQFKKPALASSPAAKHHSAASNVQQTQAPTKQQATDTLAIQIVTASYERVLHGVCARLPPALLQRPLNAHSPDHSHEAVTFLDVFLFAPHTSSIRCLALSAPTESGKRILATGGSDERINLYQLATAPPIRPQSSQSLPDEPPTATDSRNRSVGSLIHHDRAITRLHFPTPSKLFSSSEDNTVAISRTRDWTLLSSVKSPIPKPQGRPSGDTAGPGEIPAGVNDFAIHPSQKLMLSVGRGEHCMRLWNLMTGKKAGVLNFDRSLLTQVGEGRRSSGEGRRLVWDEQGETFAIAFERGAAVFGIDSKPKHVIRPFPLTKLHQMRFLPPLPSPGMSNVLALSTEDGRVLFFGTSSEPDQSAGPDLPSCRCTAQLGGQATGIVGRIKDFETLPLLNIDGEELYAVITASSDGAIRIWTVFPDELGLPTRPANGDEGQHVINGAGSQPSQIGRLIGTLETGNRITSLGAFIMDGKHEEMAEESTFNGKGIADESSSDSDAQ